MTTRQPDPDPASPPAPVHPVPDAAVAQTNPRAFAQNFSVLKQRDYAWYLMGNMSFMMAHMMQNIVRGYLAFQLTGAAAALGVVSLTVGLPMMLVAPVGGVIADRVNKRTLLIFSQGVAATTSVTISILILTDLLTFWHLLLASLMMGIILSVTGPARQALAPELVPQHQMMKAITLQMSVMNLTRVAAPAVAGVLIVAIGSGGVYLVTATLFLSAVASEIHLPVHGMVGIRERKRFHKDLMEGFRYIRSQRTLMVLLSINIVFPLFAYPVNYILPVFSEEVFHNGATGLGILSAMVGVGGVIGALIATTLDTYRHKGRLMLVGGVWMGLFFIAFTQMDYFLPALFFLALGNIGTMVFHTTNNALIQSSVPAEVRGRVMSVMMMSIGVMPLGTLPVGIAADHVGVQLAVAGSSTLLLLTLFVFFTLSRRLRHLIVEPLAHADLSPVQAEVLLAQGKITQEEADRRSGGEIAILEDGS